MDDIFQVRDDIMSLNNSDGLQPNSDHVSGIFEDSMNCFKDASIEWRWKLLLD